VTEAGEEHIPGQKRLQREFQDSLGYTNITVYVRKGALMEDV
jgi:hypothetical protein